MAGTADPLADPIDEATRIVSASVKAGCVVRVTGGVGIALACARVLHPPLTRSYADIDLFGHRNETRQIKHLMADLGYQPDEAFNALHGSRRLYFWDHVNSRQVDVFLDIFEMCHKLDMTKRLSLGNETIPLADLLLCKLQVVETNDKDLCDILAVLLDHSFTTDETGINLDYLTGLTRRDWGLWRTTTMVAERAGHFARDLLDSTDRDRVHSQVAVLLEAFERSSKSTGWRIRSRIGDGLRWYELPEEGH